MEVTSSKVDACSVENKLWRADSISEVDVFCYLYSAVRRSLRSYHDTASRRDILLVLLEKKDVSSWEAEAGRVVDHNLIVQSSL